MPRPSTREKIIEAGTALFHRTGFNGCAVEDITNAAGVPKGSFYSHFKSKELLLLESMDRYLVAGNLDRLADRSTPPLRRLKKYFEALGADFAGSNYQGGCLYGNLASEVADHSPEVRAKLGKIFTDWVDLVASVIREGQSS